MILTIFSAVVVLLNLGLLIGFVKEARDEIRLCWVTNRPAIWLPVTIASTFILSIVAIVANAV